MHATFRVGRTALVVLASLSVLSPVAMAQRATSTAPDWPAVDQALGRTGSMLPGQVRKYGLPRSDLSVTIGGVPLKPAFALGGWVAFRDIGNGHAMAMGDLVLTESEVQPVMTALQQGGVEQTALHNHLLGETPRVMYMHIHAMGDAVTIARAVRTALARTGTPAAAPAAPTPSAAVDLDTAAVARALGESGAVNGGVYQVSVPRRETIRDGRYEIPPAMGVATGINFQPTGGGNAAITGDFVMRAAEVNRVIRTLQGGGIQVTALHSHMLDEEPRIFFMHFWATGNAVTLARRLRAALNDMAVAPAPPSRQKRR